MTAKKIPPDKVAYSRSEEAGGVWLVHRKGKWRAEYPIEATEDIVKKSLALRFPRLHVVRFRAVYRKDPSPKQLTLEEA
jgi:hypothetical protein